MLNKDFSSTQFQIEKHIWQKTEKKLPTGPCKSECNLIRDVIRNSDQNNKY